MTALILLFHLRHQLILLWTIISLLRTKATPSTSSTTQTTQLLSPVALGTIAVKSGKPLTSVRKTYICILAIIIGAHSVCLCS